MKKLMIALVAGVLAASVQAAAVTWGSGTIVNAAGENAKATVTAKLFVINEATYTSLMAYATDGTKLSDEIYSRYSSASADLTKTSTTKSVANLLDAASYGTGDTAYAAILYTYMDGETETYMGNIGSYTFDAEVDFTVGKMSSLIGGAEVGTVATAWSTAAVPEPTSGLLMLLGMAGLALRRRRA